MPVAHVILQRTLVRGNQCSNNQYDTENLHRVQNNDQDSSLDIDLSQAKYRNERLKQKYDNSGKLIYAYETLLSEWRMTECSPWSSCSVSYGHRIKTHRRTYLMPDKAFRSHCIQRTYDMTSCYLASCLSSMTDDNSKSSNNAMCMPIKIGTCTQFERRFYFNLNMNKCLEFDYSSCGANDNHFVTRDTCEDICDILLRGRTEDGKNTCCMTLPWSEWSACSSVCGRGTQVRLRAYKIKFLVMGFCSEPLEEFRDCEVPCDSAQMYRLSDTRKTMIKNKFMQPLEPGPCTKFIDRFYFNVTTHKCSKFQYGGCNENIFITQDECEAICDELIQDHNSSIGFF
ncbi:unnamed protein product [Rotaria sordida]|uniref:BPTI/Kunitz inhibitor domain-containing protein n=1 Tax=Rotaria sordida TaxID=392033 RepID=A0A819PEV6_9BILA|nr:unnamed protein product [Rotaria sordida]